MKKIETPDRKDVEEAAQEVQKPSNDIGDDLQEAAPRAGQMAEAVAHSVENGDNGSNGWIRLPDIPVPRIEVTNVQLPEIRLPRVIGGAVRSVPADTRRQFGALVGAAAPALVRFGARLATTGGRVILRRPNPLAQRAVAIPVVGLVLVAAAATGALLAFIFDAVSGRRRRAQARDQITAGARRVARRLGRAQRYATSTVAGKMEQVREARREIADTAMTSTNTRSVPAEPAMREASRTSPIGALKTEAAAGNGLG